MPMLLLSVLLLLTGSYGHLQLKTAFTNASGSSHNSAEDSAEGDGSSSSSSRIVTCSKPDSVLVVRSAYYLSSSSSSCSASSHDLSHPLTRRTARSAGPCHGDPCPSAHVIRCSGERMTSDDVMKVYRHCQGRLHVGCDVACAGVGVEFNMSYFCLEETRGAFIDPCSNQASDNATSILFNYSRHTTDCDVACHCNVTSLMTSNTSQSLVIRALNLFQNHAEEEEEEEEERGQDGADSKRFPEGCNDTTAQPGPRVQIETPDRDWEVKRRAVPVQWQLRKEKGESTRLSLSFHGMHGVPFGRLWMELEGGDIHISCAATVQPGVSRPQTTLPPDTTFLPRQAAHESGQLLTYIVVAVAVTVGVMVFVVIAVALAKWRRRRSKPRRARRTKARATRLHKPPSNNNGHTAANAINFIQLEGDYCTINDVTSASSPSASGDPRYLVTRFQSRDPSQHPIRYREEVEEEEEETTLTDVSRSDGDVDVLVMAMATHRSDSVVSGSEYCTLNHGPSGQIPPNLPRTNEVIYDHTGPSGLYGGRESGGGGGEYHCLRHHAVSSQQRVIDNVYDTMTSVAADS